MQGSETAQQGLLTGLSAYMVKSGVYGDGSAYDNGYPSQMIIRDVMTAGFAGLQCRLRLFLIY